MHRETKSHALGESTQNVSCTSVGVGSTAANQQNINQQLTRGVDHTLTNLDGTVTIQQHNS